MTAGLRLRIAGDHSRYHGGCAAVIRSLTAIARKKGWRVVGKKDDYDALLMNGEGSMHHDSKTFRAKMALLEHAVNAGKPAYLVNSVWQENPSRHDDLLRRLSGISVRDVFSQRELKERHGIAARVLPDVSCADPLSRWCFHVNLRGEPAVTDFWFPDQNAFARGDHLFPTARPVNFLKWSWARSVETIRSSAFLITGRQHAVYAACRARRPFIASEGNTHKIAGFLSTANVDIPVASHPLELQDMLAEPQKREAEYQRLFSWLDSIDFTLAVPAPGEVWPVKA